MSAIEQKEFVPELCIELQLQLSQLDSQLGNGDIFCLFYFNENYQIK